MCNHLFVDGFGGMGDAIVCELCGLDKYPEAIPIAYLAAKIQGRIISESNPAWREHANRAIAARKSAGEPDA